MQHQYSNDEIMLEYSKEFEKYVTPQGENIFGFWVQTLADLELLDAELQGLARSYTIDPIGRSVQIDGNLNFVRSRIAHLQRVENKPTVYSEFIHEFNDTNDYAFHRLYPYKGKFYPRIVRALINSFKLDRRSLILDPFDGCGTTTHEATLMGIRSIGLDITPMGLIISELKNSLPFVEEQTLIFSRDELLSIIDKIRNKTWEYEADYTVYLLMLLLYFDSVDLLERRGSGSYTSNELAQVFIKKHDYVLNCHKKLMRLKLRLNLRFSRARILYDDVLEIRKDLRWMRGAFDAVITSPPYYFSLDYVEKDKAAYQYLGLDSEKIKAKQLGMVSARTEITNELGGKRGLPEEFHRVSASFPKAVGEYYIALAESINTISWCTRKGGKLAIVIGDSMVAGRKIPTTLITKKLCEATGFTVKKIVCNPLLGSRNRAIRGENIVICEKQT